MTDPVNNNEELGIENEVLDVQDEGVSHADAGISPEAGDPSHTSDGAVDIGKVPPVDGMSEIAEEDGGSESELQGEFDRLNDRHLRLVAEFNNFRRRSEQERLSAWSRAQADLVGKFLDVLDDLQRVAELDLGNATVEAIMEGIDLVERKFVRVLGEADIEMLDPAGQAFDPEFMEAMMRVPTDTAEDVDTVAQVFQKGYSLKGVLVRPARVSVYTQG